MITSRCAYCGALAENPARLSFAENAGSLRVSLPLCTACSQSWCVQPSKSVRAFGQEEAIALVKGDAR